MKLLLFVVILLGFLWSVPSSRERLEDVLRPVGVALQPAVEWALNPTRRAGVKREQDFILREIENDQQMGRGLPAVRDFETWVARRVDALNDGRDPWGQPYYLEVNRRTVTVISSGPDRTRGTADDVKASRTLGR